MMRFPRRTVLLCVSASLILFVQAAPAQEAGWHESMASAESAARRDNVPLLIHFHAWYCGPCRQMDSQVFHHRDVQRALTADLHAVQIDVTHDPDTASRYQASTVPRDVVVYPDGSTSTLNIGFMSRSSYIGMLRRVASSWSSRAGSTKGPATRTAARSSRSTP